MTLVGMLPKQDVMKLFHTYNDEKNRTVNDFMTQPAIAFEEDEPLLDICYCSRDFHPHLLTNRVTLILYLQI